ncbi:MAG TPA: hypothetical protein VJA40_05730, partial [archaeon]|nr:hypothetical protein [archaeon]
MNERQFFCLAFAVFLSVPFASAGVPVYALLQEDSNEDYNINIFTGLRNGIFEGDLNYWTPIDNPAVQCGKIERSSGGGRLAACNGDEKKLWQTVSLTALNAKSKDSLEFSFKGRTSSVKQSGSCSTCAGLSSSQCAFAYVDLEYYNQTTVRGYTRFYIEFGGYDQLFASEKCDSGTARYVSLGAATGTLKDFGPFTIKNYLPKDVSLDGVTDIRVSFLANNQGAFLNDSLTEMVVDDVNVVYAKFEKLPKCGDGECNGAETCATCDEDCVYSKKKQQCVAGKISDLPPPSNACSLDSQCSYCNSACMTTLECDFEDYNVMPDKNCSCDSNTSTCVVKEEPLVEEPVGDENALDANAEDSNGEGSDSNLQSGKQDSEDSNDSEKAGKSEAGGLGNLVLGGIAGIILLVIVSVAYFIMKSSPKT